MSDVVSEQQYVLGQKSPSTDDKTENRMKGEQRNGYQHRPESPGSDSDGYIQQPTIRNQSNTKQAPVRRSQPQPYASARYERYEGDPPTLQDREMKGRANLVKFFKDDDRLHRGVTVSINDRQFKSIESLCEYLNKKIDTKMGVRHIFNLKTKKEVKSVKELERGDICIVSSSQRFKKDVIMYNLLMDQPISPTKSLTTNSHRSSREQGRATHERAQFNDSRTSNSTATNKQVTFTIISNTDRYSKEKMILNPNTTQPFERILEDMGTMLQLKYPPATGIFSSRKPYQQIYSFSQLNREVKVNDCLFVCGKERYPEELGVTDTNEESFSEQEPESEPVRKSKKGPPVNKITPLKRRNEPSTDLNQKENVSPPRGRAGKEPKKANKTPIYEAEPRRQPTKGNKTSRYEEDNEYSNQSRYGGDESKKPARTSRQQDQPQPRKPNKSSPRYEEDEQRKPNKNFQQQKQQPEHGRPNGHTRFEDEEDEFDRSRGSDLKDDGVEREQNGEPSSEEEDDEDDETPYPQTSRTRKQERMETPEY
ncbi:echinoderm microtubule-associated protein-like CG42247 [Mizuhopecten yessoensis]|uniref:Neuronal migration protein doublecortin n=1 Tax=Mizuhopecten yessoensis TaxID=6573 RepID=A0A210QU98_MIZYE|nr:echinoderm microtubule-associated protein-like CG42247 [Mizuhopecten yessoensis]OWF52311.1 Neuronal migration protein doublecortin [Mizuhopecten yessoensis]